MPRRLEIILGPTAVGKTGYAIERALEVGSPVISCDSRQIYKELRIGTAVPSRRELQAVKHYFIRTVPVTRAYNAGLYEADALNLVNQLFAGGHETLVMCGGSMLYVDAFCYGLDDFPEVPLQLREHLMECLREEGVESLARQLKELDPLSYEELDLSWLAYEIVSINIPVVHCHQAGECNKQMELLLQDHLCDEPEPEE